MSAQAPTLNPNDLVPGTKYRVVRTLGAGGMGVVFQVVKPPNIGGVLKLMSSELTQHDELLTRFFDEVRILAQLDHPNIVKVFDYDALPDGTPFYVMELLNGRTVRDVLATIGRVPPRVAYEVTRQLLEALQCAHTHDVPVIHRDIKPENIFLHAPRHGEPVVKLIDFGVSSVADRKHDGSFVGTWSYAAPEQIRGEAPTPATDLYSAALVLYEMLCGRGPFDHYEDWVQVSEAQLKETPAPVSKFAPWVPSSIVDLIATALAKDPEKRPRDAYAFSERLFELEWASDGKNLPDHTVEGPERAAPRSSPELGARPAAGEAANANAGPGPLSKVLSTVTMARPSSKKLAAAAPATDRLGDVPLIGVPPESVQAGPTWKGGFGVRDVPAPDTNALLAGLNAPPQKPSSKRDRSRGLGQDAEALGLTPPSSGQVVIRAVAAAVTPHPGDYETLDAPASLPQGAASGPVAVRPGDSGASGEPKPASGHSPNRDTFSSHSSQRAHPRGVPRSAFGPLPMILALLAVGCTILFVVVFVSRRDGVAPEIRDLSANAGREPVNTLAPPSAPTVVTSSSVVPPPVTTAVTTASNAAPTTSSVPSAAPVRTTRQGRPGASAKPASSSGRSDYMRDPSL